MKNNPIKRQKDEQKKYYTHLNIWTAASIAVVIVVLILVFIVLV